MGTKHKHAEVIKAWADGAEVEFRSGDEWLPTRYPSWSVREEFRIKANPTVKKEGWANIYPPKVCPEGILGTVWATKVQADYHDARAGGDRIACVLIEWEEENGN